MIDRTREFYWLDDSNDLWRYGDSADNLHYARLEGVQADGRPCWVYRRTDPPEYAVQIPRDFGARLITLLLRPAAGDKAELTKLRMLTLYLHDRMKRIAEDPTDDAGWIKAVAADCIQDVNRLHCAASHPSPLLEPKPCVDATSSKPSASD